MGGHCKITAESWSTIRVVFLRKSGAIRVIVLGFVGFAAVFGLWYVVSS
jgi:hypothetical protein